MGRRHRLSLPRTVQAPSTPVPTPAPTILVPPDFPNEVALLPEPHPDSAPADTALPVAINPAPVTVPVPLTAWHISGEAVIGLAHRRKGLPCQDAVAWRQTTRPLLTLSDGAGSAAVSELGSAALVTGISRFLMTMEDALAPWLDGNAEDTTSTADHSALWAARLLVHAKGILDDLAQSERRRVRALRGAFA